MCNIRQILVVLLSLIAINGSAQVNIWDGTSVRHRVELTSYLAKGKGNPAVIVCPGGSYFGMIWKAKGVLSASGCKVRAYRLSSCGIALRMFQHS